MHSKLLSLALVTVIPLGTSALPAYSDAIDEANRFTVKISSAVEYPFGEEIKGTTRGAGFLIDKERGWVLTNAHVARRAPAKIRVSFKGQSSFTAERLFIDTHLDLSVLKIDPAKIPGNAIEAKLDCGAEPHAGRQVFAFGHPWSLDYTATRGIISGTKSLEGVEALQTDAALNPGNSGGPLIDEQSGIVVGINAAVLDKSKTEGMNFAVPANLACTIINLLRDGRNPAPPVLPVSFAETLVDRELVVAEVRDKWADSLRIGDRVLAVDGDTSARYTSRVLDKARQHSQLKFLIRRGDKQLTLEVDVPTQLKELSLRGIFVSGLLIAPPPYGDQETLTIQFIERASLGEESSFRFDDVVHSIDGRRIKTYGDILSAIKGKEGVECEFIVKREMPRQRNNFSFVSRKLEIDKPIEVNEYGLLISIEN